MSKTFMVAIDGSQQGWKAVDLATPLAKVAEAELVLVHVIPANLLSRDYEAWAEAEGIPGDYLEHQIRQHRARADTVTAEGEARVRSKGLDQVTSQVVEGNVAEEIVKLAEHINADMLFVGSRGLSDFKGVLLGSISHKLTHLAPCSCVVVR